MRPFVSCCLRLLSSGSLANGRLWATAFLLASPFAPAVAYSQDWLRSAIPPEARVHDFGTVARAANTEHRFAIKNVHSSDLHIRSVRASCGCTTPIIETEWIKPGETGSILARFNTGTFTGKKAATLTVSIDKPVFTELQLNVKGYIRSDVVLNPGELNFGEIPVGEPQSLEVTLDYAGRGDWSVVGAESPLPFVDVRFEELSRGGGRVRYRVSAGLSEKAPLGSLHTQVLLKTNDRNLTTVPIRLLASVQAPIQVSPKSIELGTVRPGDSLPQRLTIKARSEFRVLEISSDIAEISFEANETAKAAHLLNLVIVPEAQAADGAVKGEVSIKTDLMVDPIRIPLSFDQLSNATATSVVKAD